MVPYCYRLHLRVQQELEGSNEGEGGLNIWSEFISDLWEKHLPHLREELYGEGLFVFNPDTGRYGFQEEKEEEGEEDEDCVLTSSLLGDSANDDGRRGIKQDSPMEEDILSEEMVDGHTLESCSSDEEEGRGGEPETGDCE